MVGTTAAEIPCQQREAAVAEWCGRNWIDGHKQVNPCQGSHRVQKLQRKLVQQSGKFVCRRRHQVKMALHVLCMYVQAKLVILLVSCACFREHYVIGT